MEAVQPRRPQSQSLKRFLATRRGAWVVAAISATLGGLILLVFLNGYKSRVNDGLASTPVLTADRLIPEGTSGNVVVSDKLFRPIAVAEQDAKVGAVPDAGALVGRVATRDILPGQQITAADFSATGDGIRSRLTETKRAIQVPMDSAHGLFGTIRRGDRVDVMVSITGGGGGGGAAASSGRGGLVKYLLRAVRVVSAPGAGGSGAGSVILEATDRQALQLAYAADNADLWFALRPPVGATNSKSTPAVSDASLLLGEDPVRVTAKVERTKNGGTVTIEAGKVNP
jgi:Flp pilus assembly protein CpaB